MERNNALTKESDWNQYYLGRQFKQIELAAKRPSVIDDYIIDKSGKIFELGCGVSHILARSSMLGGWEVGGIDFNYEALNQIHAYLSKHGCETKNLIHGDIFSYDCAQLNCQYDLLVSFGFLEHFKNPESILCKWKTILKLDGIVISCIPNLFSINASIFKRYDPDFWAQHICYSPKDMDQFHTAAGLLPLRKAQYYGKYDIYMLIPWDKIRKRINNKLIFKSIKYFSSFGAGKLFRFLPKSNLKMFNSFVIGVYTRNPN